MKVTRRQFLKRVARSVGGGVAAALIPLAALKPEPTMKVWSGMRFIKHPTTTKSAHMTSAIHTFYDRKFLNAALAKKGYPTLRAGTVKWTRFKDL